MSDLQDLIQTRFRQSVANQIYVFPKTCYPSRPRPKKPKIRNPECRAPKPSHSRSHSYSQQQFKTKKSKIKKKDKSVGQTKDIRQWGVTYRVRTKGRKNHLKTQHTERPCSRAWKY